MILEAQPRMKALRMLIATEGQDESSPHSFTHERVLATCILHVVLVVLHAFCSRQFLIEDPPIYLKSEAIRDYGRRNFLSHSRQHILQYGYCSSTYHVLHARALLLPRSNNRLRTRNRNHR